MIALVLDFLLPLDRLFRTLGPLPASQVLHLLRNRAFAEAAPKRPVRLAVRPWTHRWHGETWRGAAQGTDRSFTFMNKRSSESGDALWRDSRHGRLWLYQLHYLDDLTASDIHDPGQKGSLLNDWIAGNPPFSGTGWEAYPLSLRIVNIVKFFSGNREAMTDQALSSLILQALTLEKRLEYHLRANHLFENAKALVFAGTFFEGEAAERWLTTGLAILDNECIEQFLPDGGHFELSPMYHGTVMWGLCDLVMLADAAGLGPLADRRARWERLLRDGFNWYRTMTHPDGEISFFNDAAFGQAPNVAAVRRYSDRLQIPISNAERDEHTLSLTPLSGSGYYRIDHGRLTSSIVDAARVGPDYQPAHAHADTLSFELSVHGQRVVVNSGTSTYDRNEQRAIERGTAAHNTVVVDGVNSSDTWAAFRVGRRAVPRVTVAHIDGSQVVIEASHDGYRRWGNGATHVRRWVATARQLRISDRIEGRFMHAVGHLHFHPGIDIRVCDGDTAFQLQLPSGQSVHLKISGGHADLLTSAWHPEFGCSIPNQRLRVRFDGREIEAGFSW